MAYQGDRWRIVPGCTCLWAFDRVQFWHIATDDANCPAHHPDVVLVRTV